MARLEKLTGLFRGDFFEDWYFAGCAELDEMIILLRYNLENRKLRLFRKLARLYFDSGRSEKCLKALDVCDELDPYDERHARIRLELLMEEKNISKPIDIITDSAEDWSEISVQSLHRS